MARQRQVFRIEELAGFRAAPMPSSSPDAEAALRHAEIMTELKALRDAMTAREPAPARIVEEAEALKSDLGSIYDLVSRTKHEIATLAVTSFSGAEMGRVSQELNAVAGGTESATHRILQAGEEIEDAARTLAAAIKNIQDQDLARDIIDQVTSIFEACNFQDIAGQRITKVTATLKFIEDHILRLMNIWGGPEQFAEAEPAACAERDSQPKLVNGPKLDGERGYVSQKEIDAMFAAG